MEKNFELVGYQEADATARCPTDGYWLTMLNSDTYESHVSYLIPPFDWLQIRTRTIKLNITFRPDVLIPRKTFASCQKLNNASKIL